MNPYFKDAGVFLIEAGARIKDNMDKAAIVQATLQFALGMERVLKGILFELNPVYVLMRPEFDNSVRIIYRASMLPGNKAGAEQVKVADEDVITFRTSLLRANLVSAAINSNKDLLFALSSARDVIAHHQLHKLDYPYLKTMLVRDYYPLVLEIVQDIGIPRSKFLHGSDIRLGRLSEKHAASVEKRIALRLQTHKQLWEQMKGQGQGGYVKDKESTTNETLTKPYKRAFQFPACQNVGILYGRPEFEPDLAVKSQ
jgi:hypothetical protein